MDEYMQPYTKTLLHFVTGWYGEGETSWSNIALAFRFRG